MWYVINMKKKIEIISNKKIPKSLYHKEIIVEPAERLLKALQEAEVEKKEITPKIRKTAICR